MWHRLQPVLLRPRTLVTTRTRSERLAPTAQLTRSRSRLTNRFWGSELQPDKSPLIILYLTNQYYCCIVWAAFASPCASDPSLAFSFLGVPAMPRSDQLNLSDFLRLARSTCRNVSASRAVTPFLSQLSQTPPAKSFIYTSFPKTPGGGVSGSPPNDRFRHLRASANLLSSYGCAQFPSPRGGGFRLLTTRYSLFTAVPTGFAVMTSTYAARSMVLPVHSWLRVPVAILVALR